MARCLSAVRSQSMGWPKSVIASMSVYDIDVRPWRTRSHSSFRSQYWPAVYKSYKRPRPLVADVCFAYEPMLFYMS